MLFFLWVSLLESYCVGLLDHPSIYCTWAILGDLFSIWRVFCHIWKDFWYLYFIFSVLWNVFSSNLRLCETCFSFCEFAYLQGVSVIYWTICAFIWEKFRGFHLHFIFPISMTWIQCSLLNKFKVRRVFHSVRWTVFQLLYYLLVCSAIMYFVTF